MEGKQYKVTIRGNNIYTDGDFRFDEKPQKDFFDKEKCGMLKDIKEGE